MRRVLFSSRIWESSPLRISFYVDRDTNTSETVNLAFGSEVWEFLRIQTTYEIRVQDCAFFWPFIWPLPLSWFFVLFLTSTHPTISDPFVKSETSGRETSSLFLSSLLCLSTGIESIWKTTDETEVFMKRSKRREDERKSTEQRRGEEKEKSGNGANI